MANKKTNYTCPMHPEVTQEKPGKCPKCGMKLVREGTAPMVQHGGEDRGLDKITWKSYLPLIVIIGIILLTTLTLSFRDSQIGVFSPAKTISYFMIGFFLTFSAFKLMDLRGFADGYSTYDLLAQRWEGYGYIYPFIELGFGLGMILLGDLPSLLWAEILVMGFSGIGVVMKLLKGEKFQCSCLGTFLKVPLTKITVIEDFGMVVLAVLLLMLHQ